MTAPLTPPDCDLQDFPFMPLHVARLRDSDLAAEASPEACWYAVLLWAASWHQLPAASLPDNEAILTKLLGLGRDVKTFRKHREAAMRGFVLCDDGRLYHPVVAEQAVTAWNGKLQQRWRTECARIKKQNQRNGTDHPSPTLEDFLANRSSGEVDARPEDVPEDDDDCPQGHGVQEKGTWTGIIEEPPIVPQGDVAGLFELLPSEPSADPVKQAFDLWNEVATRHGLPRAEDLTDARRRSIGKRLERGGLDRWRIAMAAVEASAFCVGQAPARDGKKPFKAHLDFVCQASSYQKLVEGTYGQDAKPAAASAGSAAPEDPETLWRRRMGWLADGSVSWRDEWGPRPGKPDCTVPADILREFGIGADILPFEGRAA